MEEPPFHKFLHISQNHRPVSIIAHARKAQMVLNSHRNRTVNRSCQTIAGIWLYWFAARTRQPANAISLLEFHD